MPFSKRLTLLNFLTRPELRTPESFRSIMLKATTRRLFQKKSTCEYKKSWYAGEWLRPVPMERNEVTVATTASHRLSFVATAVRCSEEFIGTINELDLQEIVLTALNELLGDKSKYQKQLQQNIAQVIRASAAITTDGIDEKLMELQQELVKRAITKKPTMRLPTRFLHSEKSASRPQWIRYSAMNSYSE